MNNAKNNYKKKCKSKVITFYLHDENILNFANEINFQKFVKHCLRKAILDDYEYIKRKFKKMSVAKKRNTQIQHYLLADKTRKEVKRHADKNIHMEKKQRR